MKRREIIVGALASLPLLLIGATAKAKPDTFESVAAEFGFKPNQRRTFDAKTGETLSQSYASEQLPGARLTIHFFDQTVRIFRRDPYVAFHNIKTPADLRLILSKPLFGKLDDDGSNGSWYRPSYLPENRDSYLSYRKRIIAVVKVQEEQEAVLRLIQPHLT